MRVDIGRQKELFNYDAIKFGHDSVGAFLGRFSLLDAERDHMIEVCRKIWRHLRTECPYGHPLGLYRFDLAPHFANPSREWGDLGGLAIKGVYEVNGHAPECFAAASMIRAKLPHIACADAAGIVARKVQETFGSEKVAFVVGQAKKGLKYYWWRDLVTDLKRSGLDVAVMTPQEVMDQEPNLVWRWGDVREYGGENDYEDNQEFTQWLFTQNTSTVFNAVLPSEHDLSKKNWLLSSSDPEVALLIGDNRVLSPETIDWTVNEKHHTSLMAKPNGGSSGNGLIFGEQCVSPEDWVQKLQKILNEGDDYSVWETRYLPSVVIKGQRLALDINVAAWVDGDRLEPLYVIVRIEDYKSYRAKRTINVAKGAGIAGLIKL